MSIAKSPTILGPCLLIGSAGFIGARLYDLLTSTRGAGQVATLDKVPHRASANHVVCDITSSHLHDCAHATAHFNVVYNLAAEHRDDVRPTSLYDLVNVEGARQVCRMADTVGARRIIFTSSVAVYGFAAPNTAEDGTIRPFNDYGRTKALAEDVYRAWAGAKPGRSLTIVRPTVVFGPGNQGNVHRLLAQIASGRFAMIGDGCNVKSMAYVDNVAAFLAHLREGGEGIEVFNYVDKPDLDMNALVAEVRQGLGKAPDSFPRLPRALGVAAGLACDLLAALVRRPLPLSRVRVEKFCATTQFAASLQPTGFQPPFSLKQGLAKTLAAEFGG